MQTFEGEIRKLKAQYPEQVDRINALVSSIDNNTTAWQEHVI